MLHRLIPVVVAAAASLLTVSSPSSACELACPEGTVCGVVPQDCSSPGYNPDEGGAPPDGGAVCTGEVEECVPAPCEDASECPAGWSCDDPLAPCSIDSEGHETCAAPAATVCLPPPSAPGDGEVVPVADSADASLEGVAQRDASAGGCTMGAGSGSGDAFGALALLGAAVLARRRRS